MAIIRCGWCGTDELYCHYHDTEWGVPVWDDRKMFENLILESFQAGLSWITVLRKREAFRNAFQHFDPEKLARWDDSHIHELMQNPGIIRNYAKIKATIHNARCYLNMMETGRPLASFFWQFTDGKPQVNSLAKLSDLPARSEMSDRINKELKALGFAFVGSTVVYAHLQAMGIINDHLISCFRHRELTYSPY